MAVSVNTEGKQGACTPKLCFLTVLSNFVVAFVIAWAKVESVCACVCVGGGEDGTQGFTYAKKLLRYRAILPPIVFD